MRAIARAAFFIVSIPFNSGKNRSLTNAGILKGKAQISSRRRGEVVNMARLAGWFTETKVK
jgi:hypothetical protein